MTNDSQKPGGGLPPIGGIGPYKVRFEADTSALTLGVNLALDNIRGELDALKTGFSEFESTLANSLTSTITRLRTDLSGIIAELNRATQALRTEMGGVSSVAATVPGGGAGGGGSFYIPPVNPGAFSSPNYSTVTGGQAAGGSPPPNSSFYIPPINPGRSTSHSAGGNTGPTSVGYEPIPGSYEQQLQQFRFDQIAPAEGIFLHEMGTMSQMQNLNRHTRNSYESAVGSLQQHLTQLGVQGKTPYLQDAIQQEIKTLQGTSQLFTQEFQQKYGAGTKTGQTLAEILQNPEAMNTAFGQSTRPSAIKDEILSRSPDLANNPELLMQEIASIQESRTRSSAKTNQNFIQAQYLLESAASSDQLAQEAMQKLNNAPAATSSSPRIGRTLAGGVVSYLAGEAIGNMASGIGGPYAQMGDLSFYANAWKQAMPYDLQAGALGQNVGVGAQSAITGLLAEAHKQHLAAPEVAQTAGLESSFAGVQGAAFLFKDAAQTYKFASYLGLSASTAAQVAGQAVGGGSTQSPTDLFTSIMQTAQQTGMSNTAIAQGIAGMQTALTSSYQTTTAAPEYTNLMMNLYKGAGMTPAERQQSLSSYESMFGHGSNLNLMSAQLYTQDYAATHGGNVGSLPTLIANANAGRVTPAELKMLIPQLHQIAMTQGETSFMLHAQGLLTKNAFGMSGVDLYKEFSNPNFNPATALAQAKDTQHGKKPGGGNKPLKPPGPPSGYYTEVLHELGKIQNAEMTVGNATINLAHHLGPWVGGGTNVLSHILEMGGGTLGALGVFGGAKALWNKIFGGGGSPPGDGGGGGSPLGGAGMGGCSPCEEQAAQGAAATATNTSKIAELLGGLGLAGGGAYALSQSGKWLPNVLSPTGQMAAIGNTFGAGMAALDAAIGSLHSLGSPSTSSPGTATSGAGYLNWSSVKGTHLSPFASKMAPYAAYVSQHTGLPEPFLLAQWSLESANGTSEAATENYNFGGIKPWGSYGAGPDSKYAGFGSLMGFAKADTAFYTQNSNYDQLLAQAHSGAPIGTLLAVLQSSGYASDPAYAQKLASMLASGAYGSYTPGHPQAGTQSSLTLPSSLSVTQYYQNLLSQAIKSPKTSHPDTPSLTSQASLSLLKQLANFFSGGMMSPSAGAATSGLGLAMSGVGGLGSLGLLGLLGF